MMSTVLSSLATTTSTTFNTAQPTMADPQTTRQLKIKTGVVKRWVPHLFVTDARLHKEEATYAEEVVAAQRTLQGLKDEGADGADIRNAVGSILGLGLAAERLSQV